MENVMEHDFNAAKMNGTGSVGFQDKGAAEGTQSQKGGTFGIPTATHPATQPVSLNQAKEKSSNAFIETLKNIVSFFQSIGTKKTNINKPTVLEEQTGKPQQTKSSKEEIQNQSEPKPTTENPTPKASPPPVPGRGLTSNLARPAPNPRSSPQAPRYNQMAIKRGQSFEESVEDKTTAPKTPSAPLSSTRQPPAVPPRTPTTQSAGNIFRETTGAPKENAPTAHSAPLPSTSQRPPVPPRSQLTRPATRRSLTGSNSPPSSPTIQRNMTPLETKSEVNMPSHSKGESISFSTFKIINNLEAELKTHIENLNTSISKTDKKEFSKNLEQINQTFNKYNSIANSHKDDKTILKKIINEKLNTFYKENKDLMSSDDKKIFLSGNNLTTNEFLKNEYVNGKGNDFSEKIRKKQIELNNKIKNSDPNISDSFKEIKQLFSEQKKEILYDDDAFTKEKLKENYQENLNNFIEANFSNMDVDTKNLFFTKDSIDSDLNNSLNEIFNTESTFQGMVTSLESSLTTLVNNEAINNSAAGNLIKQYTTKLQIAKGQIEPFQKMINDINNDKSLSINEKMEKINTAYNSKEFGNYVSALSSMASLQSSFQKNLDQKVGKKGETLKELLPQANLISQSSTFFQRITRHGMLFKNVLDQKPQFIDEYKSNAEALKTTMTSLNKQLQAAGKI